MTKTRFDTAMVDFAGSLRCLPFAYRMAHDTIFSRVRGTRLGPIWIVAQPLFWVLAMVLLVKPSVSMNASVYPIYIVVGLTLFQAVQTFVGQGAALFTSEKSRIQNVPLPLSIFVLKNLFQVGIEMVLMAPFLLVVALFSKMEFTPIALLAIPGMALVVIFGVGASLTLGTVAARVPDVAFLTSSIIRVLLFITPVFWWPESGDSMRVIIAHVNPLYHLIAVVRAPLMGIDPSWINWTIAGASAGLSIVIGMALFIRFRERIVVWL